MKRFSNLNESCVTSDVNQGNSLELGVTNHLTPVNNIVTNIRNLFSMIIPVVASVGEDGFSVKLDSSKFVSKEEINRILQQPVYQSTSLYSYIISQGLDNVKCINLGMYWVVYFSPKDIKAAEPGKEAKPADKPVKEQLFEEAEMDSLILNESDDDEELKDLTKEKLKEIIQNKDKVKASKQLELLISSEVELPREYYFAGVKDKQGNESIALRWKYQVKRPKGMSAEVTRSLINIYGLDKDGVWVGDFEEDGMFQLPDEVKKLIETVLDFLGAKKTDDPCVWDLSGEGKKDEEPKKEDEDKKEEGEDKKEEGSEDKKEEGSSKKEDEEDVEDDKSRSENDLL